MSQKSIGWLLVVLLVAQCCLALPRKQQESSSSDESKEKITTQTHKKDSSSSETSSEEEDKEVIEKLEHEVTVAGNSTLKRGSALLTKVLKDSSVTTVQTPLMREYTNNLTELQKTIDDLFTDSSKDITYYTVLYNFWNTTDRIMSSNAPTSNAEQIVLQTALKAAGIESIKQDSNEDFKPLLNKFEQIISERIGKYSEKQKEKQKAFIDWFNILKSETDQHTKMLMFIKFFEERLQAIVSVLEALLLKFLGLANSLKDL